MRKENCLFDFCDGCNQNPGKNCKLLEVLKDIIKKEIKEEMELQEIRRNIDRDM